MFNAFVELMTAWLINDIPEDLWSDLTDIVDAKALSWQTEFLSIVGKHDFTVTMHKIFVHFGDCIRLHRPLLPYNMEGMEHKHQPMKILARNHTNNKGFNKAQNAYTTDTMQVVGRDTFESFVRETSFAGKGIEKKRTAYLMTPLSRHLAIHRLKIMELLDSVASVAE